MLYLVREHLFPQTMQSPLFKLDNKFLASPPERRIACFTVKVIANEYGFMCSEVRSPLRLHRERNRRALDDNSLDGIQQWNFSGQVGCHLSRARKFSVAHNSFRDNIGKEPLIIPPRLVAWNVLPSMLH